MSLKIAAAPLTVAYCHCGDCKRWTGAPAPAFAAFPESKISLTEVGPPVSFVSGVDRWACTACHSPIASTFDYLPGHVYVPLGVLEPLDALAPRMHCHAEAAAPWWPLQDGLPCARGSGRDLLNAADM